MRLYQPYEEGRKEELGKLMDKKGLRAWLDSRQK